MLSGLHAPYQQGSEGFLSMKRWRETRAHGQAHTVMWELAQVRPTWMTVTSCLAPRNPSTFCHPLKCHSASSPAFGDTWPVSQVLGRFYSICPSQEPHKGASTVLPISRIRSLRHKRLGNLPEVTWLRIGGGALDSARKAPRG